MPATRVQDRIFRVIGVPYDQSGFKTRCAVLQACHMIRVGSKQGVPCYRRAIWSEWVQNKLCRVTGVPCTGVGSEPDDTTTGEAETGRSAAPEAVANEHAQLQGKVHR